MHKGDTAKQTDPLRIEDERLAVGFDRYDIAFLPGLPISRLGQDSSLDLFDSRSSGFDTLDSLQVDTGQTRMGVRVAHT